MSLLKFHFPANVSPPDKYRWRSPLGITITADNADEWLRKIKQHCKDNDLPLSEGWEAEAEDTLCRILPPGMCRYADGSAASVTIDTRMTAEDWTRGMSVLAHIVVASDPLVDQATAESRARICAACPANVALLGCNSCVAVADLVARIRGSVKTEADGKLAHCGVCKCALRAMVWIKPELLAKGTTQDQHKQFSSLPWCWKKEIEPLA